MTYKNNSRKADTYTIKEAIEALLEGYKLQNKLDKTDMVASWAKVMGQPIAEQTSQVYAKGNTLFVKVNSAPLKQELLMNKNKILYILNHKFQYQVIHEIIFL
ncbi:MAG: DUF721 domain-containing protein [Thermonemataceae bacterium]|nr:DUF721 domain-containing protein [Thermonemataceae bacterium]